MRVADKRLNEMDRLGDMLHFPASVNAGATLNVLLTIALTWYLAPAHLQPHSPVRILAWVGLVLLCNLLPVALLRLQLGPATSYPHLAEMNFVRDQHKFSDWVYLAASANMAFWILLAWALGSTHRTTPALAALECVALLATFSPVLFRRAGKHA